MKKSLFFIFVIFFIVSCAEKHGIIYDDPRSGYYQSGNDYNKNKGGFEKEQGIGSDNVDEAGLQRPVQDNYDLNGTLGEDEWQRAKREIFKDIFFAYNSYRVDKAYEAGLNAMADFLVQRRGVEILIEGHCDERGTREYNIALGDQRAQSVKNFLVSMGVASSQVDTLSYGKERPFCTSSSDECWRQNRRAHFVLKR